MNNHSLKETATGNASSSITENGPELRKEDQLLIRRILDSILVTLSHEIDLKRTQSLNEEVMTESEAADFLRVKPRTVQQWRYEGKINAFQEGKIIRYLKSDLRKLLKAN